MRKTLLVAALGLFPLAAQADPVLGPDSITGITFWNITNNTTVDLSDQLRLDILGSSLANSTYGFSLAADEVLFIFTNDVGDASNVHEIYIDDGTILAQSQVINSLGGGVGNVTEFIGGSFDPKVPAPTNLPGGSALVPPFDATALFSADITSNQDGLNSSADKLGIVYQLQPGLDLEDVWTDLGDGDLRIGLHIGSLGPDGEGSDSYVNTSPVPEPMTVVLLGLGLVGLGATRRLRRKQ